MNKRLVLVVIGIVGLMVVVAAGWYLGSPLFIDNTVEEAFPFEVPQAGAVAANSVTAGLPAPTARWRSS